MLLNIIRYKLLSYLKSAFDFRIASIIRGGISLLFFGGFAYGAYLFAFGTTQYMIEHTRTGLYLYHMFVSMALFVFFMSVNLGNIIVSYSTLYRSAEVGFLLTKPVPFVSIFILKFFDNFFYSSTTLLLGAFMVLLGYGSYFGFAWYYYAGIMLFVIIPFMLLAANLAVLILMGIMKLSGRFGFRKVMTGLFLIYFLITFLFFSASNPIAVVERINHFYPNIDSYLSEAMPSFLQYLPNQWVAEFLYNLARGDFFHAFIYASVLLVATVFSFVICLVVARKFYYGSWLISLKVKSEAFAPYSPERKQLFDFRSGSILPPQIEVLIKKEYFAFIREASQWIHLVVMIVLTGLFSFSVSQLNLHIRILDMQLLTYMVLFAFSGFMMSSLALRFVFPMIGLEGRAFWAIRSSPVRENKVLQIKFILGFILVFIIAEYIAVSSNIPFARLTEMRPMLLWFGMYCAFWISLAVVSLNLGLGGYFANYLERNPIRAASSQGATLTFLATLVYLVILVVIVFMPVSAYFSTLFRFQYFRTEIIILPMTLFAVISYILTAAGFIIALRSIRRDF